MQIEGEIRRASVFSLTVKPTCHATAAFIALHNGTATVTRRLSDILWMPDDVPVLANWHGKYRTDTFSTTVGNLRELAEAYGK